MQYVNHCLVGRIFLLKFQEFFGFVGLYLYCKFSNIRICMLFLHKMKYFQLLGYPPTRAGGNHSSLFMWGETLFEHFLPQLYCTFLLSDSLPGYVWEMETSAFFFIVFCFVLFCCRQSLACLELYIEQASLELRSIYFCLANAGLKTYTTTLHYCIVFIFKQLENPKFDTYSTLNVLSSMGFTFFS